MSSIQIYTYIYKYIHVYIYIYTGRSAVNPQGKSTNNKQNPQGPAFGGAPGGASPGGASRPQCGFCTSFCKFSWWIFYISSCIKYVYIYIYVSILKDEHGLRDFG